jgi:hypothetical protein
MILDDPGFCTRLADHLAESSARPRQRLSEVICEFFLAAPAAQKKFRVKNH